MKRVLIVDDHEIVRRGIAALLSEALPEVSLEEAGSYNEAVERLGTGSWDLVLVDIGLPGPSGLALVEEARRRWRGLPVLVVSGSPEREFATLCIRIGAAGYVEKSVAAGEMVAAVRKVLAGGRYISPALAERLALAVEGGAPGRHEALSPREMEVLRLVARGLSLKEIAAELGLTEKTVATYRARLGEKLHLSSNVELTRYALHHGLAD